MVNWKKQRSAVKNHEMSTAHANAKVAEALFLQEKTVASCMEQKLDEKLKVTGNQNTKQNTMKRVVDSIMLHGKQERGYRE